MIADIRYDLQTQTLHIGSGLGGGVIKRRLLKQPDRNFTIPGSTIKGRVRYYCEEFVQATGSSIFTAHDIQELFGSPGDRPQGKQCCAFSDLTSKDEQHTMVRNGIHISRKLGITKPKALFNTEIVNCSRFEGNKPSPAIFKGKILFSHPQNDERYLALLLVGLRMICRLGGNKTAGSGGCEIPLKSIEIKKNGQTSIPAEQILAQYLEETKPCQA